MLRIGLTGGIAAGKSVASSKFADLGAAVIDHDNLAAQAIAPGSEALVEIKRVFDPGVFRADGSLDRASLGEIVFSDADRRAQLNQIVHPIVHQLAADAEQAAQAAGTSVVVHDIPLLVETGQSRAFDLLVVIAAAEQTRLARLMSGRGLSELAAKKRIAAQATEAERIAVADIVLDGNGSVAELRQQVAELWAHRVWPHLS